jgi:hypothetical protein
MLGISSARFFSMFGNDREAPGQQADFRKFGM